VSDDVSPRDALYWYLVGAVSGGMPQQAADSILEFADAMVARATGDDDPLRVPDNWKPAGAVGVLEGPPIVGTTDTINAGPPRPHLFNRGVGGVCVDCGLENGGEIHRVKRPRRRATP
jgi:hypothetical protein